MKKLFILVFSLIPLYSFAQEESINNAIHNWDYRSALVRSDYIKSEYTENGFCTDHLMFNKKLYHFAYYLKDKGNSYRHILNTDDKALFNDLVSLITTDLTKVAEKVWHDYEYDMDIHVFIDNEAPPPIKKYTIVIEKNVVY